MLQTIFDILGFHWPQEWFPIIWLSLVILYIPTACILYVFNKFDTDEAACGFMLVVLLPLVILIGIPALIGMGLTKIRNNIKDKTEMKQLKEKQLEQDYKDVINMIYK